MFGMVGCRLHPGRIPSELGKVLCLKYTATEIRTFQGLGNTLLRGHPSSCVGSWTRKSSVVSGCAAEVLRLQLRGHFRLGL